MERVDNHSIQFCFEAFYNKDERNPVCDRIFSNPVKHEKDRKFAKKLNISRLSRYSGKISGNEDMILFCGKISEDDVNNMEIIFFSEDNDQNVDWKEKATFQPEDVLYKDVAIPFQTPAYKENIEKEVFIQLYRKSDGLTSGAKQFSYKPCHELEPELIVQQTRKRKRLDLSEDNPFSTTEDVTGLDNFDDYFGRKSPLTFQSLLNYDHEIEESFDPNLLFADLCSVQPPESTDGLLDNMASLSIGEKNSGMMLNENSSSETEHEERLKNIVIEFIKKSKKDTFFRLLPEFMSLKDDEENNFLHLLVCEESENLSLLVKVLECAPDDLLNQVNKMHMTPLHIAVSKSLWKVAKILLMFDADPNIKDENGNTCTHLAAMYNFPQCLAEVLTPLLENGKKKYLPALNVLNYDGFAPLHLSVKNDAKICVKLLLQAKANINVSDGKCGKTPLHFAYETSSELVTLLVSQPFIDHSVEDFNGNTPNSSMFEVHENSMFVPKSTDCCIRLSTESSNSSEENSVENEKEPIIFERGDLKERHIDEKSEDLFIKILDSNGLWNKLGLYIIPEKELNVIAAVDATPTKTILNKLKEQHGEKHPEKLKLILSNDEELKEFVHILSI